MQEFVTIGLKAPPELAAWIEKNGLAEIAIRNANKRFSAMVKCGLADAATVDNDVSDATAIKKAYGSLRTLLRADAMQTKVLTDSVKNISVQADQIFRSCKIVQAQQFLSVGLSLANLGVDAVGFAIVTKKMNELNSDVQDIKATLKQFDDRDQSKIAAECQNLTMRFNTMADKVQLEEKIALDDMDSLMTDLTSFLQEMIQVVYKDAMPLELPLTIINCLLPIYTVLAQQYITRYYFAKKTLPSNYKEYCRLYDAILKSEFCQTLQDYYFLRKGLHYIDTADIIDAQILLGINGKSQIEDRVQLLQTLKTEEKVTEYDAVVERCVHFWADNMSDGVVTQKEQEK